MTFDTVMRTSRYASTFAFPFTLIINICTHQKTFWGKCIEEIEGQITEFKEAQEF